MQLRSLFLQNETRRMISVGDKNNTVSFKEMGICPLRPESRRGSTPPSKWPNDPERSHGTKVTRYKDMSQNNSLNAISDPRKPFFRSILNFLWESSPGPKGPPLKYFPAISSRRTLFHLKPFVRLLVDYCAHLDFFTGVFL